MALPRAALRSSETILLRRIGNLIFGIPFRANILASRWREIKDERGGTARMDTFPGGLGSGPRALRRGADRRGLVGRVSRLGAGAASLYGRGNPARCTRPSLARGASEALGAKPGDLLRLVIGQGLRLSLTGTGIGVAGAFGLTRLMASLLFGVTATDPVTFLGVPLLLLSVTLLGCYLPARRAMKADPITTLKYE